jgi:hypothetical protein
MIDPHINWDPFKGFEDTEPAKFVVLVDQNLMANQDPLAVIKKAYPRIHKRIVLLWGSQELADQFNRWIFTDQEGRKGFSTLVGTAILNLSIEHERTTHLQGAVVSRKFKDRW